MSDYQDVKIKHIDGATISVEVVEVHPDMTELARFVDRKGQVRKSMMKRVRNFAALLLIDYNSQDNSFVELLSFMDEVGVSSLEAGVQRLIADVEVADMKVLGPGTNGPMHRATLTITVRSSLLLRSFRKGKRHAAVATLDGDINLY
jgi:hypothetical protein